MTRKTVFKLLLGALGLLLAYWASTYAAAYTDDAYLETDILRIAPRVDGHIQAVQVQDNQRVERGQTLATIDPTPFKLKVLDAKARLAQALGKMRQQNSTLQAAKAVSEATSSALDLATATEKRYQALIRKKVIARQAYDEKHDAFKEARDRHRTSLAKVEEAFRALEAQAMQAAAIRAELGMALYNANHTVLHAPVDGFVTALDIKPGDYASVGEPIMAVVSDEDWRVVANYREQLVRHIQPGQKVVVHLDNYPWRLFEGEVQGVAHGVSREPAPEMLLPYVEPKTNWIRLSRRFPVRIHLMDRPPDLRLLSGSDVRTLVVY